MDPILEAFEKVASAVTYSEPHTTIVLNRTGQEATGVLTAAYWVDHLRNAVLFSDSVQSMSDAGYKIFLEVGPSPTLLGMARRAVTDPDTTWVTSLAPNKDAWQCIAQAMAQLYVVGAKLSWAGFDQAYPRSKVIMPTYAFQKPSFWASRCVDGQAMIANPSAGGGSVRELRVEFRGGSTTELTRKRARRAW
jgi:acyl transferase domain-containing protein